MQLDLGKALFALPLLAAALVAQSSGLRSIGSPTTIDQPGSYILTVDLFIPGSAGVGIAITASDVWLDLNGHTIFAPGNLTGAGIRIVNAQNVTVKNGNIVNALMGAVVMNSVNVRLEGLNIRATGMPPTAPPPEMGILLVQTRNSVVRIFKPSSRTFTEFITTAPISAFTMLPFFTVTFCAFTIRIPAPVRLPGAIIVWPFRSSHTSFAVIAMPTPTLPGMNKSEVRM